MMVKPGETAALEPSRHNIVGPVPGSPSWFIVNPLSRQADILSAEEAEALRSGTIADATAWAGKGYLVEPDEERKRFRQAYLDALEARQKDEVQLFFAPWYACNFACSYCYQASYEPPRKALDPAVVDAFFAHIRTAFAGRRKYLTLFGGEPLLSGPAQRQSIESVVRGAASAGLDLAIVTNGHELESYLPLLGEAHIRELQITLDGPEAVHDGRRPLRGGTGSFRSTVRGIDAALEQGLPVNLRAVVDRQNLDALPALAEIAREHGWIGHPLFKTQLGRNYELHHCYGAPGQLYSRIELYQALYDLIGKHPAVLDFHRPAFSLARFLFDNGELPEPLFDSCPATKTEWAFDYTGQIYSCTATVGKAGESLGTFYPEVSLDLAAIAAWEDRDVLAISACSTCNLQLACGGGCGAVAKNRTGRVSEPDCRPVGELLGLGIALYGAKERILS